jgi:hypothetical protein
MAGHVAEVEILGPWSLQTSRGFWEGFTPAALAGKSAGPGLRAVFCVEGDWRRAEAEVTQAGDTAHVVLAGDGDLDAAAAQDAAPQRPHRRRQHQDKADQKADVRTRAGFTLPPPDPPRLRIRSVTTESATEPLK